MKITKYGHCCLLVEERGLRTVTDPGSFTTEAQESLTNIHVILYTHEHGDHFHLESLKAMLGKNPTAKVICNPRVGEILTQEGIAHTVIGHGDATEESGVVIEGFGEQHAPIHTMLPSMQNTGYFLGGILWYPGDGFFNPGKSVKILALPVAGPWMKTQEAVDYALALKPESAFGVHDGILNPMFAQSGFLERVYGGLLGGNGIQFTTLEIGREYDFS